MDKQLIISVGREFGSGGHVIAEALAKRFDLPLYDTNLLDHVTEERNLEQGSLHQYDEKPKRTLMYRTVRGYSSSPRENVANMQFEYLYRMAQEGKSFVVVGRCSETKLKEFPGMVSLFILGDRAAKIRRVMEKYNLTEDQARQMMKTEDWKRKSYHNYYCKGKWGDSRNYELSVNSSKLGIDRTVDLLEDYIRERQKDLR